MPPIKNNPKYLKWNDIKSKKGPDVANKVLAQEFTKEAKAEAGVFGETIGKINENVGDVTSSINASVNDYFYYGMIASILYVIVPPLIITFNKK